MKVKNFMEEAEFESKISSIMFLMSMYEYQAQKILNNSWKIKIGLMFEALAVMDAAEFEPEIFVNYVTNV